MQGKKETVVWNVSIPWNPVSNCTSLQLIVLSSSHCTSPITCIIITCVPPPQHLAHSCSSYHCRCTYSTLWWAYWPRSPLISKLSIEEGVEEWDEGGTRVGWGWDEVGMRVGREWDEGGMRVGWRCDRGELGEWWGCDKSVIRVW